MIGQFSIPATRKSGKKIDSWSYRFPDDEKAIIDVHLDTSGPEPTFYASCSHPRLSDKTWTNTDIRELANKVRNDVESRAQDLAGDRWKDAVIFEVSPDAESKAGTRKVSLSVTCQPIKLDTGTPRGNDGTRRIIRDGKPAKVSERSHSDSAGIDAGGTHYRLESNSARLVLLASPDTLSDIARLQEVLEQFSSLLTIALSPGRANPSDIPTPADLVELMSRACDISSD